MSDISTGDTSKTNDTPDDYLPTSDAPVVKLPTSDAPDAETATIAAPKAEMAINGLASAGAATTGRAPSGPSKRDSDIIAQTWLQQAEWSKRAGNFRSGLQRWRTLAAIAGILGAVLETYAATGNLDPNGRSIIALLGAVVLVFVPIAVGQTTQEQVGNWVSARSASEGLKEEIYRFLAGGSPYGLTRDIVQFVRNRNTLLKPVDSLAKFHVSLSAKDRTNAAARPTTPFTLGDYISKRVDQQITGYYTEQSVRNARMAEWYRLGVQVLGGLAAAAGALSSGTLNGVRWDLIQSIPPVGPWVAVLTTIVAAIGAYMAAERFDELAVNYAATARQLTELRDLIDPDTVAESAIEKFVDDIESVISTENESWRTAWKEPTSAAKTP